MDLLVLDEELKDLIKNLTKKEKILLNLLFDNAAKIVTYEQIEAIVYQDKYMSMNALRALVKRLRLKLNNDMIQNILDQGYTLNHEYLEDFKKRVEEIEDKSYPVQNRNINIDPITGMLHRFTAEKILLLEHKKDQNYINHKFLFLIQIDHFKIVNIKNGYAAGDFLLKEVSNILKMNLRISDYAWRWCGYSFLMLLSDLTLNMSQNIAIRINNQIAEKNFNDIGKQTVSIGITSMLKNDTLDMALIRVESALSLAKDNGKNRVEII